MELPRRTLSTTQGQIRVDRVVPSPVSRIRTTPAAEPRPWRHKALRPAGSARAPAVPVRLSHPRHGSPKSYGGRGGKAAPIVTTWTWNRAAARPGDGGRPAVARGGRSSGPQPHGGGGRPRRQILGLWGTAIGTELSGVAVSRPSLSGRYAAPRDRALSGKMRHPLFGLSPRLSDGRTQGPTTRCISGSAGPLPRERR